jgi:sialic acid synthase SpsE
MPVGHVLTGEDIWAYRPDSEEFADYVLDKVLSDRPTRDALIKWEDLK